MPDQPTPDAQTKQAVFPAAGGELGARMRALDWAATPLGPIADWPAHLRATVNLMLPAQAQIVLFWGPQFVALYNDAYAPTIGAKHPGALGRPAQENWAELWDDLEPLLRRVREAGETVVAKDRPFYIERHGYPETAYFDISYSPVRGATDEVDGVLCIVSETTERVNAGRALARAQERLTQALNASGMIGVFDWDTRSDLVYSDPHFAEMFSVDPARARKGAPLGEYLGGIHSDDVERVREAVERAIVSGEKYVQEYRLLEKNGVTRSVEARGECLRDADGAPTRFVGVVVDISGQKDAQQRQQLLLQEMNHRIKNLVAVFRGLIGISARSATTAKEMADSLAARLDALMRAKELVNPNLVSAEVDQGQRTTVDALVRAVLAPYAESGRPARLTIAGPPVAVGPHAVTSLALALHETATNAAKYGALSRPEGEIRVDWRVEGDAMRLDWIEKGGPAVEGPPGSSGFGSVVTRRSVVGQLDGEIEYRWPRDGLELRMTAPLQRLLV
ncbi:MAG TPA: PAS domain-containing protein [Rhodoblastus sp.]|nr:PAS domain-containing protein [Rhodoblastus sp.]